MVNEDTPPPKGTTEQPAPADDLIWEELKTALEILKLPPDEIMQQVEAKLIHAAAGTQREAIRLSKPVSDVIDAVIPRLPPVVKAVVQNTAQRVAKAVANSNANANPPGVTAQQNKPEDADPVDLSTGQLVYRHVDLSLDGAGIHFEFVRTYRSQAHYPNGPLGVCWDYNLNLWLRKVSDEVMVCNSGELREDRYTLTAPRPGAPDETPYYAPPEGYHAILMQNPLTGLFELIRPDGLTYYFEDPENTDLYRIQKIVDTFGNSLVFEYINDLTIHVTHIYVNDPTRVVTLHFDDLGRIDAVGDSSGRVIRYTYDEYDDLIAATLPATKDYPLGRTTFYEYTSATGPVAHELLSVSDADGHRYLDVEYGNDDGLLDYARVVRQRDDQGEWLLEYATIGTDEVPGIGAGALPDGLGDTNTATRYTAMVRPNGHFIEHWFNNRGNLLFKLDSSFDEDGQRCPFLWRYLYNVDGELIASLTPEGVLTQDLYGRDQYLLAHGRPATDPLTDDIAPTADERRAFGNHLGRVRRATGGLGVWPPLFPVTTIFPNDIVTRFTYEPNFQLIASQSDPRTTRSLDPSITTRTTRYEYRTDGALLKITNPATTGPDGKKTLAAVERFDHDTHGRLTQSIDPEGHVTQRDYFPPGQTRKPESVPSTEPPLSPLINVSIEGHLQAFTVGKGEPDEATTRFDVNARGVTTEMIDPRSFATYIKIDTTDQPQEVIHTLVRQGKPNVSYSTRFKYTLERKIRRQDRDVQDDEGNPLLDGHEQHLYQYNDTGLLVHESFGGLDPTTWLVTRHIYDCEGLPSRTISPGGSVTHFRYDPRRLLVATTRGFNTPEASTERTRYDGDGRKRATVDGRGNVTRYDYDAFGRVSAVVQIVDVPVGTPDDRPLKEREGHTRLLTYDALDNVVLERLFEWRGKNSYALLSRTATQYDERGQAIKVIRDLFPDPVTAPLDTFENGPPPGSTQIETWMFLDRNGRTIERREGVVIGGPQASLDHSTTFTYDASGRQTSMTVQLLPKPAVPVTQVVTTYDGNGNPVRVDQYDFEYNMRGTLVNMEVISKVTEFDSLNRRVAEIDGFGNRTEYRYDSRDLLLERRDALGNVVRFDYDRYGRRAATTEVVDNHSNILTTNGYDDDGQVTLITRGDSKNPSLVKTRYEYDALHRRTATVLAATTSLERRYTAHYDAAGNVVEKLHANHLREVLQYDALNRLIRVDFDRTAVDPNLPVLGMGFESFEHDGLGRLTHAENDVSAVDASFDSLGRSKKEVQTIGHTSFTITRTFDALGNRTQLAYPSGRLVNFHYDLANRLITIEDVIGGGPGGGIRLILERSYVGMRRRRDRYGNRTSTLHEYDAVGRSIAIHHRGLNQASLLRLVQLYDAGGNLRHNWQSGSESIVPSQPYGYDGIHRLITVGRTVTTMPDLAPFLPPKGARHPLSGQASVDQALAPLDIPSRDVEDSYTYDAGGNRVGEASPLSDYSVDQLDQITGRPYDLDGNPIILGNRTFGYDQHGRLVEVKDGSNKQPIFSATYDALGRRILLQEVSGKTHFVYDGPSEIAEYGNGALLSEHVVAAPPDDRVHLVIAKKEYVVHRDLIGSTRLLTDKNGSITARYEFDPYGRAVPGGFEGPSYRYRFMGREWDASIGLYHFRARHYEVETGRFLQHDPAWSEPGRSVYQAFRSNPLIYVDPLGTHISHPGDLGDLPPDPTDVEAMSKWALMRAPSCFGDVCNPDILAMRSKWGYVDFSRKDWLKQAIFSYAKSNLPAMYGAMGATARPMARIAENPPGQLSVAPEELAITILPDSGERAGLAAGAQKAATSAIISRTSQSYQPVVRGGAGERGVGVLYLQDASRFSPAELELTIASIRDADLQAGMAGGLTRTAAGPWRAFANRVARIGSGSLRLDSTQAPMHSPDVAGGGDPLGPIIGGPRSANTSFGGQWGRYGVGFVFEGYSLADKASGSWLYLSLSLEHEPPPPTLR